MAHLEILEGFHRGKQFLLPDEALVGRHPESFLCLPEGRVSRQHARFLRRGGAFIIEDLNSSNGVMVQGQRIPVHVAHTLHDGDEILICSTRLVFRTEPASASPAPPASAPHTMIIAENVTRAVALEGEAGSLLLRLLAEDAQQPEVAMALDASVNLVGVSEAEQHTDTGLQEALKRLQAMCKVSTVLGGITEREAMLYKLLDCLFELFPAAERAFLMLREKESATLVPVVAKIRHGAPNYREEVAISQTIVNEVTIHKRSILSFDALDDTRFNQNMSIVDLSIRSMMCAPLVSDDEILGLVQVDTCTIPRGFSAEDLQLLTGISMQAAIAVKNLQLHEAIEAETARRTSLQRYFSPGLVEMLMSGDVTEALGGNAYYGTVLMADIIGFTAMSEKMEPAHVVAKLNRYFTIMQKVVYDHRGNVDKFNGDAIMAFWGVPRADEHDIGDAILTAMIMQEKLWPFNLQLSAEGQSLVHMGIGLNSGEFIAGNIGSEDKIEFTLIGDAINLAARIEQLAGRYQVLVSEATWAPIKDLVCAVRLPPTLVKGKTAPVSVYSIRAIYNRFQDNWALALPCRILDAQGDGIGQGIIIGSPATDPGRRLLFHTTLPLKTGTRLTLQPIMPEYHEVILLTTRVESSTMAGHDGLWAYSQAILVVTDTAENAGDFLAPGSCLTTAEHWRPKRL